MWISRSHMLDLRGNVWRTDRWSMRWLCSNCAAEHLFCGSERRWVTHGASGMATFAPRRARLPAAARCREPRAGWTSSRRPRAHDRQSTPHQTRPRQVYTCLFFFLIEAFFGCVVACVISLPCIFLFLRSQTERVTVDTQIEPYKADNARLVKENNDLHMQILKLREETDQQIRG